MIDEEQYCGSLHIVVCVARPARCFETPLVIVDTELDQLVGHSASMYLADPIDSGSVGGCRNPNVGLAMFFAGKCYASTMDCISTDDIKDLSILLAGRTKGSAASWYVIEQVLHL